MKLSPTGRNARSEPNMQSIPIRTPEGAAIKAAFASAHQRGSGTPPAKIYIRRNGSFGASCDGTPDTGHHITEDSGRFTVRSIRDMKEDVVIAKNATRAEAEAAIAEDWRAAE